MSSQSSLADKRQRWSRFLAEEVNGKPFFKDQDVLWGIVEAACQLEHNNVPTWVFHAIDQRGIIEMLVNSSDTPDVAFRNRWQQVERAAARCRASGEGAGDVNPNYGAELAKWLRLHNRRSTEFIRLRHELQGIELFRQKNFADKQRILSNEGQRLTNTRRMIDRAPSVDHDTAIWSATESI